MSELKTTISHLPHGLTLCNSLVKNTNHESEINFFVNNLITRLESLKQYENGKNHIDAELSIHMEIAAPSYTASLEDVNSVVIRKFFSTREYYKDVPPSDYYAAFKKELISKGFTTETYFKSYEQNRLEIVQNLVAENDIENVRYEDGDFCLSIIVQNFKHVECTGETDCVIVDAA